MLLYVHLMLSMLLTEGTSVPSAMHCHFHVPCRVETDGSLLCKVFLKVSLGYPLFLVA